MYIPRMYIQAQLIADTCTRAMEQDRYVFIIQLDRTQAAVIYTDYGQSRSPTPNSKLACEESLPTAILRMSSKRSLAGMSGRL